jgi:beta-xylosidase
MGKSFMMPQPPHPSLMSQFLPHAIGLLLCLSLPLGAAPQAGPWTPDLGNGTYKNPVLYADYSDPDAIRVGDDYWMTASSFSHVPGLPILHSRDLVNWELVNHALPRLVPEEHFSTPRHGAGVWAPALRFHAGKYWIFYPDPDFGIYVITATDPRGQWTTPRLLKGGKGIIDPCPFWDEDGQAYLIHGWAKSRAGISNLLTLHAMKADATELLDEGKTIIDANQMPGWRTLEGPKLYKHGGYYWVFAPAGGVTEGYQAVFRAKNIFGPYESRIVLDQGSTAINGPHQGAWIDTPGGEQWFLHFQELPAYGRVVHLQPMMWNSDGWPVMGKDPDSDGKGEPVLTYRKPSLPPQPASVPPTSDDFSAGKIGLQWQWQANPQPGWFQLGPPARGLRLNCQPLQNKDTLWTAGNLLMQKFPAPTFTMTTCVRFNPDQEGDASGLVVFGDDYAWLGLKHRDGKTQLVYHVAAAAKDGATEKELTAQDVPAGPIWLRVQVSDAARCQFSWSTDGTDFRKIGEPFAAKSSRWVGAKAGLFAISAAGQKSTGHAEFEGFTVTR